jgi:hypothetical protein
MPRLSKIIKGHHYQVGRFNGRWYVVDTDKMKFIYGPFSRRETAEARIRKLPKRMSNPKRFDLRYIPTTELIEWRKRLIYETDNKQYPYQGESFESARKRLLSIAKEIRKREKQNPTWVSPRKAKRLGTLYQKAYQRFERENPGKRKPVLIYGRVLKIFAQKTEGPFKGQRFVHTFKPGAIMVGMPDGSLRISHP